MFSNFSLAAFCNITVACLGLFGSMFCFTLTFILLVLDEKNHVSLNIFTLFLYKVGDVLCLPIYFL